MERKRTHLYDKFSDEEFAQLAAESESLADFMRKLGYASGEGTFSRKSVTEKCHQLGINPPKATGRVMVDKAIKKNTLTDDEYFVENSPRVGHNTRDRLIKHHLMEYKCAMSGEWNGKQLTLELDHINGDHHDNRLTNLRFLCPNCHAQTETFRGKKKTPPVA